MDCSVNNITENLGKFLARSDMGSVKSERTCGIDIALRVVKE